MSNFLESGAVLPSGLMGHDSSAMMAGFNKSYRNTSLRVGVVIQSYPVSDPNNHSKLTNEYDVSVIEQYENKGITSIIYRNCMSRDSLGSIADYLEFTIRPKMSKSTKDDAINLSKQDGAIVLLLCLDGVSDKAIIIGGLIHPDRTTKLSGTAPQLFGEYNGVAISISEEGAIKLSVSGPTDNKGLHSGTVLTSSASVSSDGTIELSTDTATITMDLLGNVIIKGAISVTVDSPEINLGKDAAEAIVKGNTFKQLFDSHLHPTPIGPSGPPVIPLSPSALSTVSSTN